METLFIGRNCIRLLETASTNTYAINLLKEQQLPEGSVVITDRQVAGRGQRGNQWISEPAANITLSIILYPNFLNLNNHFLLSKIIALSIQKTILHFLKNDKFNIKIKWPNDIMADNLKISGVLIENSIFQGRIKNSIIGIGLNVNQRNFGSNELIHKATSLNTLTQELFDIQDVLNVLYSFIEAHYLRLKNNTNFEKINQEYLKNLLHSGEYFTFNEAATSQKKEGYLLNVLNNGELVVRLKNGELKNYLFNEIQFAYGLQ